MTEALTRAKPRIDDPEELNRVVEKLVDAFAPIAIYLFGSRARREAWQDSDYDLMIVLDDRYPREKLSPTEWSSLVRSDRIEANICFSRESAYGWRRHEVGTLEFEVEVDGVQLYPSTRGVFTPTRPSDLGTLNVDVVREWLDQVQRDLDAAFSCVHGPRMAPDRGAFHVQQAAEKLAKAALVAHRMRPEKTHEIADVVKEIPEDFALKQRFSALDQFSDYAVIFRYPGGGEVPIPSAAEVQAWIAGIEALKADFERWLGEREAGS
jgi:HEPN domain-containing protein